MYRIDVLLKQNRALFHTNDLALLWNITNRNTLYTAIKRYVKKGILHRIHKGFYATKPLEKIDPIQIGVSYLHTYAYLSTESVLSREGIILQNIQYITLISSLSKQFAVNKHRYLVRRLKDDFLHQSPGIIEKDGVKIATVERAVADLFYFNPHYHLDASDKVDWDRVKKIKKEVGYQ